MFLFSMLPRLYLRRLCGINKIVTYVTSVFGRGDYVSAGFEKRKKLAYVARRYYLELKGWKRAVRCALAWAEDV